MHVNLNVDEPAVESEASNTTNNPRNPVTTLTTDSSIQSVKGHKNYITTLRTSLHTPKEMSTVITEIEGDLFKDAPDNSVLIHACNCQGSWGKGIAKAFRENYPEAYRIFRSHCQKYLTTPKNEGQGARTLRIPEGTTLLIPPQEKDFNPRGATGGRKKKQWIACLFTSWHYGPRNRSPPNVILANTELAVADLKRQLEEMKGSTTEGAQQVDLPGELWGCRFNAGLFAVEWGRTKKVLEDAELPMTIVKLAGE
ncbi:ADP-ribose 1''-phosphate phosphatase [Arachnomyces sp. PD_36]|nr:ADP-ribose 1''-phosphate phosphatase [Arachnomyces sp. PD_36]